MAATEERQRTLTADTDPYDHPQAYLRSKGWKNLGPMDWQSTLWVDPLRPAEGQMRMVKRMAPHLDDDGKGGTKVVIRQVHAQDGSPGPHPRMKPVEQYVYDPPSDPMSLQMALIVQTERDRAEQLEKGKK